MSEKKEIKELNKEQLDKVAGGRGTGYASAKHLPSDHGIHISMGMAKDYIGKEVYFVTDGYEDCYGYGTLIDSKYDERRHDQFHYIFVKDFIGQFGSCEPNKQAEVYATVVTLYEKLS